jgi:hypothetical protein
MALEVRVEGIDAAELPAVEYRWDADTDILSVTLRAAGVAEGLSGSVDLQGEDGAWLLFEVSAGRLASVEVAVWPDVRTVEPLTPPAIAGAARLRVPSHGATNGPGTTALEVETPISAVADKAERTIHFRIGPTRPSRALQVARDLLVELDQRSRVSGLWFLNVPPFPSPT